MKFAPPAIDADVAVRLYEKSCGAGEATAGAAARDVVRRARLLPAPAAWDLLSFALMVTVADLAARRDRSPDGWTREIELIVPVADPDRWRPHQGRLAGLLRLMTTDRWEIEFCHGTPPPFKQKRQRAPIFPDQDCVSLLSGGLDSLVGLLDLLAAGRRPFAVSQTVRGDAKKQQQFAAVDSGTVRHLQLGHAASTGVDDERSQRARSFIFLAFGVLAATATAAHRDCGTIDLHVPENGFIALNPPLTGLRLGALSTRTAHPNLLRGLEEVFAATELRVSLINPYAQKTKGEMLSSCGDQMRLAALAATSTSCGRFLHYGYTHCGRCVPCQVRRAALLHWGVEDTTSYVYHDLGQDDADHAGFDDVRAVQIAVQTVRKDGLDAWLGTTLAAVPVGERAALQAMIGRGIKELASLHRAHDVR
jgi:hypothetical protein